MNSEEWKERFYGTIRAASDGVWEAILSVASFPTVVAHKRYVERSYEGDVFETGVEWARDQLEGRCRLCASPMVEAPNAETSVVVDGRTICFPCGSRIASAFADPYQKFLEGSVETMGNALKSKIAISQDTTLTPESGG